MLGTDPNQINAFFNNPSAQVIFSVLAVWSLIWKGFALWRSSKNNQKKWFIAMLILNTFGILEIVYLFYFSKLKEGGSFNKTNNDF